MKTREKILKIVSEDSGIDYETLNWALDKLKSYDHLFKILMNPKNKTVGDFKRYVELDSIPVF